MEPLTSSSVHNATQNKSGGAAVNAKSAATAERSVEEIYEKKSQLEHILLRPDTYVGSTRKEQVVQPVLVRGNDDEGKGRMEMQSLTYAPGLFKIFDEILVNAADNSRRDATQDTIRVDIQPIDGLIRVFNNGAGVPVAMHKKEGVYVPELIFGHLLTSSNYDDDEKRLTGGRNGYGAKLANIFSEEFVIETCDGSRKLRYKQVFKNNMMETGKPKITACKATDNWTCITFKPDFSKFYMVELEEDTVKVMQRRVYDIAASLGKKVKVFLNGSRVPVKGFEDYVRMFLPEGSECVHAKVGDRWEVCVAPSEGQFQQMSFVNSIATTRGGTHITHVAEKVTAKLLEHIKKKHKNVKNLKPFQIKNHLWVFVNALIENPSFDTQTKETLTSAVSTFGSKCDLQDNFFTKVLKTSIIESVLAYAAFKQSKEMKKTDGAKRQRIAGIAKLDDANDAGGKNSQGCTLILTEGDSAKSLAISGLSVVGRDSFGVFPLRGKLLNVRDASHDQIMKNVEIQSIKQILGLQHGKVYTDTKSLRYGKLMIMTDQDHDGSHIKGLIMNYIQHFYPSLLKVEGFLIEFITPIVKATKGNKTQTFYTMPEYVKWREDVAGSSSKWSIKYYKGLGTSTTQEAKEYFANIKKNTKTFVYGSDADSNAIDMAFSKKRVEDRKEWLRNCQPDTYLDHTVSEISFEEFVNKELVLFSLADLQRSIPSIMDGQKPGQRKVLYCVKKRNLKKDMKVAQLAGYVGEHSAYHHGEQSLVGTIVNLAQDYVGSNNINLLVPSGQFGTRIEGGKDHASGRYIFTRMASLMRSIFPEQDDPLLTYLTEEGQSIEPDCYLPIIPMILVNGGEGIGTGWSCFIPNYNPRDLIENIKRLILNLELLPMIPFYRGFKGTIIEQPAKNGVISYLISGSYRVLDATTLEIDELPIRKWTQDYKNFLESMMKSEKKNEQAFITDYREYHTDSTVRFVITMPAENLAKAQRDGINKVFKLTTTISLGNMTLFNAENKIERFNSAEDILTAFYPHRYKLYEHRREARIAVAKEEMRRASNIIRFIQAVIDGDIVVYNRAISLVVADLKKMNYDMMPLNNSSGRQARARAEDDDENDDENNDEKEDSTTDGMSGLVNGVKVSYEYLYKLPIRSFTLERKAQLQADVEKKTALVEELMSKSPSDIWVEELDMLLEQLDAEDERREKEESDLARLQKKANKASGKGAKKGKAGSKAAAKKPAWEGESDDDDDMDDDDDDDDFDMDVAVKKKAPSRSRGATTKTATTSAVPASVSVPVAAPVAPKAAAKSASTTTGKKKLGAKSGASTSTSVVAAASDLTMNLVSDNEEEDDADCVLPLSERLAKFRMDQDGKGTVTASSSGVAKKSAATVAKKPSAAKRPSAVAPTKNSTASTASSPAISVPAKKMRRRQPSPAQKKSRGRKIDEMSEDDDDDDMEDVDEEEIVAPTAAASRSRRQTKKIIYVDDDEDEEEEDEESEFEDDEDDDVEDGWSP